MSVRVLAVSDEVDEGLAAGLSLGRPVDVILACGDLPAGYLAALMNGFDVPLVFLLATMIPTCPATGRAGLDWSPWLAFPPPRRGHPAR